MCFYPRYITRAYSDLIKKSPALDLVNDCFRFVTGFFELISTSAPHIYHSALLLSPKKSIVRMLYGPQTKTFARVIQGIPASWDPSIASTRFPGFVDTAVWSPCGRFIAVAQRSSSEIAILDAVTLEQLYTTCPASQLSYSVDLIFSPDGRFLTGHSRVAFSANHIVSWDLQTGGLIGDISIDCEPYQSISYSECGTMFGVLFKGTGVPTIVTYNALSGSRISSHPVKESVANTIWTHGDCLQFATVGAGSIVIWEVGFTSSHAPVEVNSLSTPDNFPSKEFLLLPILSRLAFILQGRVLVWDGQNLKTLLDFADIENPRNISFSPDGHFFVCGTEGLEFYLWKESPNGYILHQKFIPSTRSTKQAISPDGGSIVTFGGSTVQLWHTTHSPTDLPDVLTRACQHPCQDLILEFSPDKELAAVARQLGTTVTVLNLKSSDPQLTIDTCMEVYAVRVAEGAVIVTDGRNITAWHIPTGDCTLGSRANIQNSAWTTTVEFSAPPGPGLSISISPNLNCIATKRLFEYPSIYDTHTGKLLMAAEDGGGSVMELAVGFTPDGCDVWCGGDEGVDQWRIVQDSRSGINKLDYLRSTEVPPGGFPWQSSRGHQVTDDGWILSPNRKRLLWLPHHWRSDKRGRMWSGKFLALLYGELPEAVVLELEA